MLTLTYVGSTSVPVEADVITPALAELSPAVVAALPMQHGNQQVRLGDFFRVRGQPEPNRLRIEGDCRKVKGIGARMASGKLLVHGSVGMHLGAQMTGGELEVHGDADDWAGAEMRGGRLHLHGNAGNLAGAGYRGSRLGMRGGAILIDGNAGDEVGSSMRGGVIAVGGEVGDFLGVNVIAGTLLVFGSPGKRLGAGMKRGAIVCLGSAPTLLPTFRFACVFRPLIVRLYLRQLAAWDFVAAKNLIVSNFRRFSGDHVALGKGEVLVRD